MTSANSPKIFLHFGSVKILYSGPAEEKVTLSPSDSLRTGLPKGVTMAKGFVPVSLRQAQTDGQVYPECTKRVSPSYG